jgi:hypothetical protein
MQFLSIFNDSAVIFISSSSIPLWWSFTNTEGIEKWLRKLLFTRYQIPPQMQMLIIPRYFFHLAKLQELDSIICWCGYKETCFHELLVERWNDRILGKKFNNIYIAKVCLFLPSDIAIPLLGIYPKIHKNIFKRLELSLHHSLLQQKPGDDPCVHQ